MMDAARDRLAQIRLKAAAVIPAYREEKHVGDIVRRTRQELDHVLVVDDGSDDKTADRAREAGAEVIVHSQNRGKGEAIKTGLRHWLDRQFAHVIILDADGQHLPQEINRFIAAAASSAAERNFFLGNRMNNLTGMPFIRRVVNRYMSNRISRVCGQEIPDTQCGFRMLDRQLIPELLSPESVRGFDYETEMLIVASRKGYPIQSVPITTVYSDEVSNIHPLHDAVRFFKLMRRYSRV
jgi:glycosyltransferase involved in cell wall biosynthesis